MFDTLLIANRGEIACRIIRTAKRMGVRTVAVFSDADADAQHVRQADEAVRIGPAPVGDSYLRGDRIIEAARQAGADAIHPGYGFLSENAEFVDLVTAAGLTFVGPSAAAIRAMGLKDAAKRLMSEAGVPVVPGYHGGSHDPAFLAEEAGKIGYPVLIKARAGGGGKGMRRVDDPAGFAAAIASAQREAESAFGDAACLIERYVTAPRHIEIQVFGDRHGNFVHLFERDCSLQRRHQKVIEEAPAPGMRPEMRKAMGAAAVRAAEAVGYEGAGTVEFIVDGSEGLRPDRFFFMEMNTRLQVEHPVTEAITGLDLVELQMRVAAGEPLPFTQADLAICGHAIEARLYAEDPANGFLPATGRLDRLRFPASARVDTGVVEGDTITPFYDPMIAKLVVHGQTRAEALGRLGSALGETEIAGTVTNLAFLKNLTRQADFVAGAFDTALIEREIAGLTAPAPASPLAFAVAALVDGGALDPVDCSNPWTTLRDFRLFGEAMRRVAFEGAVVAVARDDGRTYRCETPAGSVVLGIIERGDGEAVLLYGERRRRVSWCGAGNRITVFLDGAARSFVLDVPGRPAAAAASSDRIVSPMPGTVRFIGTGPGDMVEAGAVLAVVEAMKMEHALKATEKGVVEEVLVAVGDQVAEGALLVRMAAPS